MAPAPARHGRGRPAGLARLLTLALALGTLLAAGPASARPAQPRIVGGHPVSSIAEFPFQVALYDPQLASNPFRSQFCGGVIIDPTHVVTAAHCVTLRGVNAASPAEMEVLAGTNDLNTEGQTGFVEDPVSVTSFNPKFEQTTGDHDIGVLTLQNPLPTGPPDGVSKIAAIQLASALPTLPASATVSGWGFTHPLEGENQPTEEEAKTFSPSLLQSAQVPLVSPEACASDYASIGQPIKSDMICAGGPSGEPDSCLGDSGGPLVAKVGGGSTDPEDFRLLGTVDFGYGCAQQGFPGVYQSVLDSNNAAFVQSSPPQAPLLAPSISGTPQPGQILTCNPGSRTSGPEFFYQFYSEGAAFGSGVSRLTPELSPGNTYTVQSGDVGARILCFVYALDSGGYALELSPGVVVIGSSASGPLPAPAHAVPAVPSPPPPPPPAPPTLQVVSTACKHTTCTVNVLAYEGTGSAAISTVEAKLTFRQKASCRRNGKRASCTRTVTRRLAARAIPGSHFVVVASDLKPGAYTLTLTAIDIAGIHQTTPTKVALVVTRVKKNQKKK